MNLREALIAQAPSLALQRAAADEIARLDRKLQQWHDVFGHLGKTPDECGSALYARDAAVNPNTETK